MKPCSWCGGRKIEVNAAHNTVHCLACGMTLLGNEKVSAVDLWNRPAPASSLRSGSLECGGDPPAEEPHRLGRRAGEKDKRREI